VVGGEEMNVWFNPDRALALNPPLTRGGPPFLIRSSTWRTGLESRLGLL